MIRRKPQATHNPHGAIGDKPQQHYRNQPQTDSRLREDGAQDEHLSQSGNPDSLARAWQIEMAKRDGEDRQVEGPTHKNVWP